MQTYHNVKLAETGITSEYVNVSYHVFIVKTRQTVHSLVRCEI
jgi:hypothetical protein